MTLLRHSLFTLCRAVVLCRRGTLCAVPALSVILSFATGSTLAATPPEEQIVSVRCHMLSLGPPIYNLSLPLAMGGRTGTLNVSNSSPGAPFNYRGPRLMRFYQGSAESLSSAAVTTNTAVSGGTAQDALSAQAGAAARTPAGTTMGNETASAPASALVLPPPFAEVMLPANNPAVLLLFIPGSDGGKPQVAALPFDEQEFVGGSFRFQNFTQELIAVNIGKHTLMLQPMATDIYQHSGGNSRDEGMVRMARRSKEGSPEIFYSSRWTHIPEQRTWVFFLPGKTEGSISVRSFYDMAIR